MIPDCPHNSNLRYLPHAASERTCIAADFSPSPADIDDNDEADDILQSYLWIHSSQIDFLLTLLIVRGILSRVIPIISKIDHR